MKWTKIEEDILKNEYPSRGYMCLPNKPKKVVISKANRMGLILKQNKIEGKKIDLLTIISKHPTNKRKCICKCECGNITEKAYDYIINSQRQVSCGCIFYKNKRNFIQIDKKIGLLTPTKYFYKNKTKYWQCICKCGNTCTVQNNSILRIYNKNNPPHCGCLKPKGKNHSSWKGFGDISATYYNQLRHAAKKRNITFDIQHKEIADLLKRQNNKCALSGIELSTKTVKEQTASLDRIDSNKSYILNNCWWVHKTINKMKWDIDIKKFISLCTIVHYNHNNDATYNSYRIPNINMNCISKYISRLKYDAKTRNIYFNLSKDNIYNIYSKQHGLCKLSKICLKIGVNLSVDRINSSKGYTLDNVWLVDKTINQMKNNLKLDIFLLFCSNIAKYCQTQYPLLP